MKATIWIKKDNEEFWRGVTKKSDFVNNSILVNKKGMKLGHENRVLDVIQEKSSFACSKCGMIKVAGRCLTKGCK